MLNFIFRRVLPILALAFAGSALGQTTVTLMQGLNGYTGTTDSWFSSSSGNQGADQTLRIGADSPSAVVRFKIFAAEGGPVPDNAIITSATLSMYKFSGPDGVFKAWRLLKNWDESQVTATVAATGINWTAAGAASAGNDYLSPEDGQGSVGDAAADGCTAAPYPAACWLNIDVTTGVQGFRADPATNFGWKITQFTSSGSSNKNFNSSENTSFPSLRPKLTITYTVPSGNTATLREGLNTYAGTTDSKIVASGGANTNYGAEESFFVVDNHSAVLRFAIFASEGGPVPDGATITSATLSLYKFSGPDGVFSARRLLKNWSESQVTWNVAATGAPWQTPGALGAADVAADPDGQGSVGAGTNCSGQDGGPACWLNIDVTSGVQWFSDGAPNYGWRIGQVSSSLPGNHKNFNSRENTSFPSLRPQLTVTYDNVDPPCTKPTAHLTASPGSGPAPLNVTFNASGSTPGSKPITNLRLVFGDNTQDAEWTDKSATQQHAYTANNTYTATLTVTSDCGTSAPVTRTINVGFTGPTAQLVATTQSGTAPLPVTFDASGSTQGSAPIQNLKLVFGDNTPDAQWTDKSQTQPHTYATAGTRNATLTVTDANGLSDSKTIEIAAHADVITLPLQGRAVTTFHSMSLYWRPTGSDVPLFDNGIPKGVPVQYRKASDGVWRRGYDMVYDTRSISLDDVAVEPARGSLVHLEPNTPYVVQFGKYDDSNNITWMKETSGTTWNENFPVDSTVNLNANYSNGSNNLPALHIQAGGTGGKYRVYDGAQNNTQITANNTGSESFGIRVSASHVIIRNVTIVGGRDGIRIDDNVTDVVIEGSDISRWGRFARTNSVNQDVGENNNAAIRTERGSNDLHRGIKRIVIQRNSIHDPEWGAAGRRPGCSSGGCYTGPKHIEMIQTGGNHVIRYNELYSTNGDTDVAHHVQDGISGQSNDSDYGAPGQDSDIYLNRVQNANDDCIEAEGGGMNVRIWKNYTDMCSAAIATTAVTVGPAYIWRNVHNRSRKWYLESWDDDHERPQAFKAGAWNPPGGRRHIFHNSVMQHFDSSLSQYGLGHGAGIAGNGTPEQNTNTTSRNNIFHDWKGGSPFQSVYGSGNDYDYDMAQSDSGAPAAYAHPFTGAPSYKAGHGPSVFAAGKYQLKAGTLGHDVGQKLFNFNDDLPTGHQFLGANPDLGAHEEGSADMVFGRNASGS